MNISKKIIAILTAIAVVSTSLFFAVGSFATEERTAVIKFDVVNIRSGAGLTNSVKDKLTQGTSLIIIKEKNISDGYIWYRVQYEKDGETKKGWVRSDCITIFEPTAPDQTFEEYLTSQNFPESYKTRLRTLHAAYPEWVFVAQHTNLKWDDVIVAETRLGMNLVQGTAISSWKSTQTGAYDWDKSSWKSFDSGNWVMASKELIEYYIDPRNMLDDTNIFQFLRQSYDAGIQTAEGMANVVSGTFLEGTYREKKQDVSYTDTLMTAAEASGVSPYALASMIIIEQGSNGTGSSISGKVAGYEGLYNFFNIGAYATSTMTAVQRGLWYANGSGEGATSYNRPWNTRTKSIVGGAIYYGEGYVKAGQDTLYLKKFNVQGNNPYTHQYMTNIQGAAGEGQRLANAFGDAARQTALTFKIPVYLDMPEQACVKPTGDGSPNNMLQKLSVSGQNLTPTFNKYTTSYSLIVDYSVASVDIGAQAVDSNATITGTGVMALKVGTNKCNVQVKAQNGDSRTYQITIIRQNGEGILEPTMTSSNYKLDKEQSMISGITDFPVKASDFKDNISVIEGSIQVTDSDGKELKGNVGTGCKVQLLDAAGKVVQTWDVVLYGDTNGDGVVNALDLLRVQKCILGVSKLKGLYKDAADTGRNDKIDALDLLQVQKQIIGKGKIKQD